MKTTNSSSPRTEKIGRIGKIVGLAGAFLGALLLWLYAIGYDSTLFERTVKGIPVTVEGADVLASEKGFTLVGEHHFSSINVVAKGKRSELNELEASDFRAVVDLSMADRPGEQPLNIVVYSPNGIEIVSQSSGTVTVFVDELTQRTDLLTVTVETGDGYIMTEGITSVEATANPLSVLVSGPKSQLENIGGVFVRFDLTGKEISDNLFGYGSIELRDKQGNVINNPYISVSETTAYVSVSVTKQKNVPVRVMFTGGVFDPTQASVLLSAESVAVSGAPNVINALNELVLKIDETLIEGEKSFEFAISSLLPAGVYNESGSSRITAKVTLPEMAVRTYHISKNAISVVNLPVGESADIGGGISIKVIGPRDAFEQIDPALIAAVADYNNIEVNPDGSFTARVKISLGNGVTGVYIQNSDYKINFTVEKAE